MNKKPMILLLASFMLASCGGQSPSSSSSSEPPKEEKWNISKDDSSELYAEVRGKALQISGRGFMKDFASADDVPWKGAQIESIGFSDKTYSVGKNAFSMLSVDYVILPDAMEKVGANAFNAETNVLAITRDTEFDLESEHIYFYADEVPTVEDRYWQSDKTSGDIIPKDYVPTKADQWYYDEDDEPVIFAPLKVLFIGNSFTYRNGVLEYSGGIPGLSNGIAEALGKVIETYSITGPGWYLSNHAKATDTCGKQVDKLLNAVNDFDYIVLQEQSVNPFENYSSFLSGVQALQAKIEQTQTKAKTYLYETWGSPFSANERKITVPQMERKLDDAYTKAGEETNLPVSYIGRAFRDVYLNHQEINLYGTDNRHQGFPGAYLSAATHVASMLGLDVREATYTGSKEWSEPTLADATYAVLRETAYRAGNKQIGPYEEGEVDPEESSSSQSSASEEEAKILRVACWGRFIEENRFNRLMEAYVTYAQAKSLEYTLLDSEYYIGKNNTDPYYYIANFTAKILEDQPEVDIVLPCADNFNANQSNLAAIELIPIDVYGQTNRRVARFNDDDLTMSFFDFAKTDEAAAILSQA